VVFGGTSAGCAILGHNIYTGATCSVTSDEALADPYNRCMTFAPMFLPFKYLSNIITDTHFVTRDRMGRSVTFVARVRQDLGNPTAIGLGIDEETNVALDTTGNARMFGVGTAYFIQSPNAASICQSKTPLTYKNVQIMRISAQNGDIYDFNVMNGSGVAYSWDVLQGVIQGPPYGP